MCLTHFRGVDDSHDQLRPQDDRAEESNEEKCAQYDSADDLTEDTFVGLDGHT